MLSATPAGGGRTAGGEEGEEKRERASANGIAVTFLSRDVIDQRLA